ncbi:uncharacterized protein LOC133450379 [Cololabis saira]|uniref:uncharacterized protein LOC133450379 n=1 Tax=Cololabis saira TaxID=129043 RepID=UPI002AD4CCBE|nr:uncharacterized protein LOC133450379 [Cololabis saira]
MLATPAMPFQQPPSFLPQTVPAPQATAHFTLSTANPAVRHPNTFASRPSPVPANLRKQIIDGNYINLALLLMPSLHQPPADKQLQDQEGCPPPRGKSSTLSKELTPTEFAYAFSLYRDVMCASFPLRRQELDDYLSNILNLALRFGGNGFYLYHIHFASEAAARLQQFNEATYWGTLDTELYCRIFAARTALTCSLCGAASHPASSCSIPAHAGPHSTRARPSAFSHLSSAAPPPPLLPKHTPSNPSVSIPVTKGIDARGRPIMHQGGRSICNNFNDTGCHMSQCRFLHVCSYCGGGHARPACPHNPTSQKLGEHLSTPINIPALGVALRNHPNPCFVKFLVKGFSEGFHPGIISSPSSSYECKNLLSAINEPESVDRLLAKEVKEGFMIGPFPHPPFPNFRISPLGITTRKYSGKKRIIVDLSAPHGSFIPSINSLIPSEDFSLHYATINHAIALIKLAGKGSWLSKADITSAFKVLPIHPDFWQYFGVRWRGAYYFAVRLTFGCKSSPKLFDTFSEALCWILSNNHGIPFLVHLLDDFLVITPPSSPPASGLVTLTSVFSELGVPLSAEKTEGPSTSLEFLGITLDTDLFQASLPTEKLNRISLLISNFLLAPGCTKRQLLSLLGHLNFAMRIIPQGRAFISHLLSIASAVPSLLSPISLDNSSRAELRLWLNLLATWNGITFFYDDQLAHPHDINLYTDAAPSIGFGGFYDGRWFAAGWPPELANEHYTASSALYEIYPISVAAILWGHEWTRKSILIYSDNLAVVDIINKGRSNSSSIMPFMRRLVWHSVIHQYILRAAHVPGHSNTIADSLSRFSFQKFRSLAPHADPSPTPVPPYSALTFNV